MNTKKYLTIIAVGFFVLAASLFNAEISKGAVSLNKAFKQTLRKTVEIAQDQDNKIIKGKIINHRQDLQNNEKSRFPFKSIDEKREPVGLMDVYSTSLAATYHNGK